jgi:DNA-binding response OmpR family regulator
MKKTKIMLLEDEHDIRDLISFQLKSEGHEVVACENAEIAISILEQGNIFDLFIVDWMLPGQVNGQDFIKKLRNQSRFSELPIIMVTALSQPENIISGLDAGADDYITKPFDLNVLSARVRVQLRTAPAQKTNDGDKIYFMPLEIECLKCRVWVQGEEITLTSTEFKILLLLVKKPGHVFTRAQLINSIQGENVFVTGRTIDTHIAGLRKKMGIASDMIETIRGIGYRFKDAN